MQRAIAGLRKRLDDPAFFGRDPAGFNTTASALQTAEDRLAQAEDEWLTLELIREEIGG